MELDVMNLWLDFSLTSLYGRVGAASLLPYVNIHEYSRRDCILKLRLMSGEVARKVMAALSVAQGTLDGL